MQCCMGKHVDPVYVKVAVATLVMEEYMICAMSLQLYTCARLLYAHIRLAKARP